MKLKFFARAFLAAFAICFGMWLVVQIRSNPAAKGAPESASIAEPASLASGDKALKDSQNATTPNVLATNTASAPPDLLVLVGTQPGSDPRTGTAQLGRDPHNPQTYVANALIGNGSRLVEVYENRVVLERAGKRTTIFKVGVDVLGTLSGQSSTFTTDQRKRLVEGDTALAMEGIVETRARVALASPTSQSQGFLRGQPVRADGQTQGFEIAPGQRSSVFSALGFKSGDVITAVDGAPLDNAGAFEAFVKSLERGDSHTVSVKRGEQQQELPVDGAQTRSDQTVSVAQSAPPPGVPGT